MLQGRGTAGDATTASTPGPHRGAGDIAETQALLHVVELDLDRQRNVLHIELIGCPSHKQSCQLISDSTICKEGRQLIQKDSASITLSNIFFAVD
jgi:hypothetical protein